VAFRAKVRDFVEREIFPHTHHWDEKKSLPLDLYKKTYEAGILPGVVGAPWAGGLGHKLSIQPPENFDYFHELIILDEFGRCGSGGVLWGLLEGVHIGLPPVLNFGSEDLRYRVGLPVLKGEGTICLCITEPYAGSDVGKYYFPFTTFRRLNARSRLTLSFYRLSANIRCAATKSACGTYYTVTGEKKWITNGVWADFFTVAVRTGGPGMGGISLLVIEKTFKGVECKRMDCMGVWASGTSFVTFDEVKVPIANLIGKENAGFGYVMHNFNHERWGFVVQANRFARVCYEEAFLYAHKRRTFGKKLIEHPVIRAKLADMIRQIDATHHQMVRAAGGPFSIPGRLFYRSW
jgi:alkylation response protein AidB-like acyl-CoA dehydrogenase